MTFFNSIFLGVLVLVLVLEGAGIKFGREIALYLIIFLPALFLASHRKREFLIPKRITFLFGIFLLVSCLSVFYSKDSSLSIKYLLIYFSVFLTFLYVYNEREFVQKWLVKLIFALSFFYALYSIFILTRAGSLLTPNTGYQFVFSKFNSHNHLGDFLILPLTTCFYLFWRKSRVNLFLISLVTIFLLPYFLFSYSRSAYLSLSLTLALMFFMFVKEKVINFSLAPTLLLIFTLVTACLFFFSVSQNSSRVPVFDKVYQVLTNQNSLLYKSSGGGRFGYLQEGWLSLKETPLQGVGPGNFVYASKKFEPEPKTWTETAHNIFVDIFVENGIFAGVVFLAIIGLIAKKSEKNLYFYLGLGLLLNFQTDYTYRIYSLFLLFFVLLGSAYTEENLLKLSFGKFIRRFRK